MHTKTCRLAYTDLLMNPRRTPKTSQCDLLHGSKSTTESSGLKYRHFQAMSLKPMGCLYNKKLCYCRGTARRATSVEIWPFLPERDYVTFGSLLSQFRLSVVCRLSVTLVHPTQGVEPFGKISSPLCTLAIL